MLKRLYLILLVCIYATSGFSQDSIASSYEKLVRYDENTDKQQLELSDQKIEDFKNDEDFDYREIEEQETAWDRFKRWLSNLWRSFVDWLIGDYNPSGFMAFVIRMIPYLILFGIVCFVIWVFYKLNPGARLLKSGESPEIFFTEEEEIIKTKDIKALMQRALQNNDFRLAIRYYYLFILKKLTDAELIAYEFDKTNSDYINEIHSEEMNRSFRKVTNLYDYVWYGNFDVSRDDFNKAQQTLTHFEQQIPIAVE